MDDNAKNEATHVNDINESDAADNEVEVDMFDKLNELEGAKIESANDCCCEASKRIDFDRCEDYKEACLSVDMLNCQTRLLRVFVDIHNVCKNRLLAISVVLTKSANSMIISQKGGIVFTGASMPPCKTISKEFCFTLPGNLCEDPCPIDIKVVSNYIYTNPFGALPCKDMPCDC